MSKLSDFLHAHAQGLESFGSALFHIMEGIALPATSRAVVDNAISGIAALAAQAHSTAAAVEEAAQSVPGAVDMDAVKGVAAATATEATNMALSGLSALAEQAVAAAVARAMAPPAPVAPVAPVGDVTQTGQGIG